MTAQKNPPDQNNFLATALERELLSLIGEDKTLTAEEIASRFSIEQNTAAWNALEGCLAKHFVKQNETGHIILTESGRRQV
ncbi:MAG: hypothetical protein HDR53_06075 [Treponema sp.]|nr:hypothetical protein [Treponema sp.]MBD5442519.1 hypothetical protein [Treponema sp.]